MTYELVRRTGVLMVPRPPLTIDRAVRDHAAPQVVAVDLAHEPLAPALEQAVLDTTSDDDLLALVDGLGLPGDADASLRNGRVAVAVRRSA